MNTPCRLLVLAALASAASPALAQSNVSSGSKFSWSENCGWMNWRDAGSPLATQGVRLQGSFLTGSAWGENIGFISFGDGSPANSTSYANINAADFGVNVNTTSGELSGFAWGENTGWINFSGGALASPPNPARLDTAASRFRGFAWGENIGWVNLDDAAAYVGFLCPADFDQDTHTTIGDIFAYLDAWFARDPRSDINMDGAANVQDIFDFLAGWFAGC